MPTMPARHRRGSGRVVRSLRRLFRKVWRRVTLRICGWTDQGFVVRGEDWRACWMGSPAPDRDSFRQLIDDTYRRVQGILRDQFQVLAPGPRRVFVFCGTPTEMVDLFKLAQPETSTEPPPQSGYFVPDDVVLVAGDARHPHFRYTVAHEICHAFGHHARGGEPTLPWIDEGAAGFVAEQVAPRGFAVADIEAGVSDWATGGLPFSLRTMLGVEATDIDSEAYWRLGHQAAVFLQFLWDDRTQNPRPWDTVRRAFNGIQPEALSAIPSFECASAKPLEALEQQFRAYCQQQTQGLILSRQRRYGALTRAPERFN